MNPALWWVGGGLVGFLAVASLVGLVLRWLRPGPTVANLNERIWAWWVMVVLVVGAVAAGPTTTIVLFALVSFLALREMVTLSRTRRGDHRTLFYAFFIALPLQYVFVGLPWYAMFTIFIPVYGFIFLAIRSAVAGDTSRYLERVAKVQFALFASVYCLSHLPALLMLDIAIDGWHGHNANLLLYIMLVAQLSDVFQYVWGKLLGRHPVVPGISPHKTWEGLIGGVLTAIGAGTALYILTPFTPWQAAGISAMICLLGFCGGLVMSAVKRDAGIKDFGNLLAGHGGVLDRVDSLVLSAPVFFHILRYYFTV